MASARITRWRRIEALLWRWAIKARHLDPPEAQGVFFDLAAKTAAEADEAASKTDKVPPP